MKLVTYRPMGIGDFVIGKQFELIIIQDNTEGEAKSKIHLLSDPIQEDSDIVNVYESFRLNMISPNFQFILNMIIENLNKDEYNVYHNQEASIMITDSGKCKFLKFIFDWYDTPLKVLDNIIIKSVNPETEDRNVDNATIYSILRITVASI